jgi:hypothetical protein
MVGWAPRALIEHTIAIWTPPFRTISNDAPPVKSRPFGARKRHRTTSA